MFIWYYLDKLSPQDLILSQSLSLENMELGSHSPELSLGTDKN